MLGFVELFVLIVIIAVLFGPFILSVINRYQVRFARRNRRLQKVAQQRKAEALAQKQAQQAKLKIVLCSVGGALVLFGLLYLAVWPVEYQPKTYTQSTGQAIVFTQNNVLDAVEKDTALSIDGYKNITQVRFYDDWIYAATQDGKIIRIRENNTGLTELVSTGGAIISFDFDAEGNIIFTDAMYEQTGGALLKASFDGFAVTVTPLVTSVQGQALCYPTGVEVAADGTIYFIDATNVSALAADDVTSAMRTAQIAHTTSGTLYAYLPDTASCTAMVTGLSFGTGLALSPDEQLLYLSQFADQSIWTVAVEARETTLGAPDTALFAAGLQSYPAGLCVAEDGTIWVACYAPEIAWFEQLSSGTALRQVLLRLPEGTRAKLLSYGGQGQVAAFAADGNLVANYQTSKAKMPAQITSVCAVGNRLYLAQGNASKWIGYLELS